MDVAAAKQLLLGCCFVLIHAVTEACASEKPRFVASNFFFPPSCALHLTVFHFVSFIFVYIPTCGHVDRALFLSSDIVEHSTFWECSVFWQVFSL